ncbi:SMP-30/gluconolactonase/LRE family protein [Nocardioides panzhihuensis]|uniref:Sugar lactone lactonase YvrE n=1 Tax=Nocardioides panzhihuensis TaxID=860243 RepID=A0A7Z0DI48_9ACTN|nr:SMP-30/gluconolactonase/LRE family protein [Nocardioides panzhihuensis]NYI75872.1 sugar lactone lactonase YvrE [Nocardioides panzhihuensis]
MGLTPIKPFEAADLTQVGTGLNRPECVLAAPDGSLYTGDWTLGIARISPDGTTGPAVESDLIAQGFRPNGIALTADGDFLFANMGRAGGVWRVDRQGAVHPFAIEIAGRPIPRTNFVLVDGDKVWITISSLARHHEHFTAEEDSGQILLVRDGNVTLAADGLNWTNEMRISPDGSFLFVNETFACRTTRFDLGRDGSLSNRVHLNYPRGTFPDGMAFDAEGALWVICVLSNRLLRVAPDLTWTTLFEDVDRAELDRLASAHVEGRLTWDDISRSRGSRVSNLASVAFGGPDLKTLYLGGLGVEQVQVLRSPVAGVPLAHWGEA